VCRTLDRTLKEHESKIIECYDAIQWYNRTLETRQLVVTGVRQSEQQLQLVDQTIQRQNAEVRSIGRAIVGLQGRIDETNVQVVTKLDKAQDETKFQLDKVDIRLGQSIERIRSEVVALQAELNRIKNVVKDQQRYLDAELLKYKENQTEKLATLHETIRTERDVKLREQLQQCRELCATQVKIESERLKGAVEERFHEATSNTDSQIAAVRELMRREVDRKLSEMKDELRDDFRANKREVHSRIEAVEQQLAQLVDRLTEHRSEQILHKNELDRVASQQKSEIAKRKALKETIQRQTNQFTAELTTERLRVDEEMKKRTHMEIIVRQHTDRLQQLHQELQLSKQNSAVEKLKSSRIETELAEIKNALNQETNNRLQMERDLHKGHGKWQTYSIAFLLLIIIVAFFTKNS